MSFRFIPDMVCASEGDTPTTQTTHHTKQMNPFKQAAPFIAAATAPLFLVIAVATFMEPKIDHGSKNNNWKLEAVKGYLQNEQET